MLNFAQAGYLVLLLLVPLFFAGYALVRYFRRRRLRRFGDEQLVRELIPSASGAKGWVRITLFSLGFFFFVIGLARPQIGAKLKQRNIKGVEIMLCLDVSNSMLAEDYTPNRLERAKLAISRLVDKLEDDRIGLIIFAGRSFVQLPVTTDYVSAKMFMNSVSTESVPVQGTAVGDAINTAMKCFSEQSEKSRAIIVITDGENHTGDPVAEARQAAEYGIAVYTIGIGTPEGKPMMLNGDLIRDSEGEIVVSKLDEDLLRGIAEAGGGAYVRAGNSEFGLEPIVNGIKQMDEEEFNSVIFEEYDEQFMYFFAIALLFFVLELLVGERKTKRNLFE